MFGGSGAILFAKNPNREFEVFNDFNSDIVNLFRCVRDRPFAFLKEVGFFPLVSREEFTLLKNLLEHNEYDDSFIKEETNIAERCLQTPEFEIVKNILESRASIYDVERAAAFYKIIRTSYGSGCKSFGGRTVNFHSCLEQIYSASCRLSGVIIENKDFEVLIKQYDRPESFFYCDPPYYETEDCYEVGFSKENHQRLHDTLENIKGKFLLSYNDCDYIRDLYSRYVIVETSRLNNLGQRYNAGGEFKELLIANYDVNELEEHSCKQLTLFDEGEFYEKDYIESFGYKRQNDHSVYIPKSFRNRV